MIRPIKLTPALIDECVEEFRNSITASRMYSGSLKYEKSFRWQGKLPPAQVIFSMTAYMKMTKLIDSFSSEIAWHCTVHRDPDNRNIFRVDDVFVSPQKVTGATVNSDQEEYEQWLCSLPDEVFDNLKMQCHSHVNMGVSPSGVDTTHWSGVLNTLVEEGDVFYIFMIWNKKLQYTVQVYDLHNNTYYDGEDVKVDIDNFGVDLSAFLDDARKVVTYQTYTSPYPYSGASVVKGQAQTPTTTPPAKNPAAAPAAATAREEWKSGENFRENELAKRKEDKARNAGTQYDGHYGSRYGSGYGGYGYGAYDRFSDDEFYGFTT